MALHLVGCERASDDPRCLARTELLKAAALSERADAAERAGDDDAVRQAIESAKDLLSTARTRLRSADTEGTDGPVRRMTEATNYLGFIIETCAPVRSQSGRAAHRLDGELRRAQGEMCTMSHNDTDVVGSFDLGGISLSRRLDSIVLREAEREMRRE